MEEIMNLTKCDFNNCLNDFCSLIKLEIDLGNLDECLELVKDKMKEYPHSPVPHNLLGILMEIRGNHELAMKHFRAAWALDPCYEPASKNLGNLAIYGTNKKYIFS